MYGSHARATFIDFQCQRDAVVRSAKAMSIGVYQGCVPWYVAGLYSSMNARVCYLISARVIFIDECQGIDKCQGMSFVSISAVFNGKCMCMFISKCRGISNTKCQAYLKCEIPGLMFMYRCKSYVY